MCKKLFNEKEYKRFAWNSQALRLSSLGKRLKNAKDLARINLLPIKKLIVMIFSLSLL